MLQRREASVSSGAPEHELTHQYTLKKEWRRDVVTSILSTLRNYATIQELILWYNAGNEAGVIPAQLQIDAINAIGPFVDKHNLRRSPPSTQLVDQIMENSRKPLCVTKITDPRDLYKSCSGDNLRLETIGFLLATAGRSLTFGFSPDTFSGPANRGLRARLVDELLSASTQCITITSLIGTVNDVSVWMYYENYLFTTMICGYSGTDPSHSSPSIDSNIHRTALMATNQRPRNSNIRPGHAQRICDPDHTDLADGDPSTSLLLLLQSRQSHFHLPRPSNSYLQTPHRHAAAAGSARRRTHRLLC